MEDRRCKAELDLWGEKKTNQLNLGPTHLGGSQQHHGRFLENDASDSHLGPLLFALQILEENIKIRLSYYLLT